MRKWSNQSILKEINPEYSLEELMLKLKLMLQNFGHLMWTANSLEKTVMLGDIEGRRKRGQQRMKWLDSFTDSTDMNLSKLQEIVEDRGAWHATIFGFTKSWTRLSNWTTTTTPLLTQLYHLKIAGQKNKKDTCVVTWVKKNLVRLGQFLLYTLALSTGDKNGIYRSSSTLLSEVKSGLRIL